MIEILLQAERALSLGMLDQAQRMYRQAADADPRNSIAVVGLARVALERGDEPAAWRFAQEAIAIDAENVAAQRLASRLEEVWAYRGRSLPDVARAEAAEAAATGPRPTPLPVPGLVPAPEPGPGPGPQAAPERAAAPDPDLAATPDPDPTPAAAHPSVVDRLFRRNRP